MTSLCIKGGVSLNPLISYQLLCMLLEFWSLLPSRLIFPFNRESTSGLVQELRNYYHYKQEVLNHSKNKLQSGRHG